MTRARFIPPHGVTTRDGTHWVAWAHGQQIVGKYAEVLAAFTAAKAEYRRQQRAAKAALPQ
jgi:hypothetical protein